MKATRLFLLALALLVTACAGLFGESRREGVSSSLVQYLYPEGEKPPRAGADSRTWNCRSVSASHSSRRPTAGRPCPKRSG